jgi:putative ABC transport system permease protein
MRAVLVRAITDLRRRRLQAAIVFVTALLAVGTAMMALTLQAQSRTSYDTVFNAQQGAHLQVIYDSTVDARTLAATPALIGAAKAAGPYVSTDLQFQFGSHKYLVSTIGRDNPDGQVEQLRVVAGQWPASGGEIALTQSFADLNHISIGDRLKVVSVADEPQLTVVAKVFDIDEGSAAVTNQHAWMLSSAVPAVTAPGSAHSFMDYRFTTDPTADQLQADLNTLRGSLPAGSITGSTNYIAARIVFGVTNLLASNLLGAFSVFALLATVAVVANLVTGIVISSYREIGIMKAVGFTPLQVEMAVVVQIVIPTAVAALVALPLGAVASQPLLANSSTALGLPYQAAFSPALAAAAFLGAVAIAAVAAFVPALRAGRLKASEVIANASAPRGRSGRWLRRLAAGLRLPRPAVLGAGDALARPLRAVLTILAIFVGVVTVIVALGFPRALAVIVAHEESIGYADVLVNRSPALPDAEAMRIFNADPHTARVVGRAMQPVAVPGLGDQAIAYTFRGDSSQLGYLLFAGRWYSGPGEAVAPRGLMHDAHLKIGDRFTATVGTRPVSLLLVGEVYDANNLGHTLFVDWSTISPVQPDLAPSQYLITLTPGSDVGAYVRRVAAVQPDLLDVQRNDPTLTQSPTGNALFIVAAVVIVIGGAAIFNTLLLNTRERVRDTATLKTVGMSPRQVMVMVAASAALLALVGGVIGVPAGFGVNTLLVNLINSMGNINDTPPAMYEVFAAWELLAIALASVAVAVAAALLPGRWAARTRVMEVLHAE